jgi:hypothetical protein
LTVDEAPKEPVNIAIQGAKTLTFDNAKDKVDKSSETTNQGYEFVHFICCKPDLEANDGEAWVMQIARLMQGFQKSSLLQVMLALYTVDLIQPDRLEFPDHIGPRRPPMHYLYIFWTNPVPRS